jgi:hypothetical protein
MMGAVDSGPTLRCSRSALWYPPGRSIERHLLPQQEPSGGRHCVATPARLFPWAQRTEPYPPSLFQENQYERNEISTRT